MLNLTKNKTCKEEYMLLHSIKNIKLIVNPYPIRHLRWSMPLICLMQVLCKSQLLHRYLRHDQEQKEKKERERYSLELKTSLRWKSFNLKEITCLVHIPTKEVNRWSKMIIVRRQLSISHATLKASLLRSQSILI